MTAIDTTTSQGQLQLANELERRKLRLHREAGGYRLEARTFGSINVKANRAYGTRRTPEARWVLVATLPDLAAVAAYLGGSGE